MRSDIPREWLALRTSDPERARQIDARLDDALQRSPLLAQLAAAIPRRKILLAAVEVSGREQQLGAVIETLRDSCHDISVSTAKMGDRGKFANINAAIAVAENRLEELDWLVVIDDDIACPPNMLDAFLGIAEASGFLLAQPAHRVHSYASHAVTQRRPNSLARRTNFVEIGPFTAFHRRILSMVAPFPETRWAWGLDWLWTSLALKENWEIGVIDGVPIEHLRPPALSYDARAASREGFLFKRSLGVDLDLATVQWPGEIVLPPAST